MLSIFLKKNRYAGKKKILDGFHLINKNLNHLLRESQNNDKNECKQPYYEVPKALRKLHR
jgi:hypothetical protein